MVNKVRSASMADMFVIKKSSLYYFVVFRELFIGLVKNMEVITL